MIDGQFSWTKQWYPVSPINYLDSSRPNPIALLSKNLVVWQDKNQNWIAMDDVCPHRLAKLSIGSIDREKETLVCRYHGWCFNSEGKCSKIPMSTGKKAEKTACDSQRSQVKIYPTMVVQDLLWIWPDRDSAAFDDCLSKQPATTPEFQQNKSSNNWHMLEVPLGYTVSMENSFDPAHAPFVHQGIGYFSPKTAVPMQHFKLVGEMSSEKGFIVKYKGCNLINQTMDATRTFVPPCSNTSLYNYSNGKTEVFQLYFVPTKPGYCKYIGQGKSVESNFKLINFLLKIVPNFLLTAFQHLYIYKFNDQDITVMYPQEIAYSKLKKTWSKAYYLATLSDKGSIIFRTWLDKFAGGVPSWGSNAQELSDQQLYDRWHRHTKYCPICRSSASFLEKVRVFCNISAKIFIFLALIFMIVGLPLKLVIASIIMGFISLFGSSLSDDIRHSFISSISKKGLSEIKLW